MFDDMTSVAGTTVLYSQVLNLMMNRQFTLVQCVEFERKINDLSGMTSKHPAYKIVSIPFVEDFLLKMHQYLNGHQDPAVLASLVKVVSGEEFVTFSKEIDSAEIGNLDFAPEWYKSVLDFGKKQSFGSKANLPSGDTADFLFRRLPLDTLLGTLAHRFLVELFKPNPDFKKLKEWWSSLNGEQPLRYRVTLQGLFVFADFLK